MNVIYDLHPSCTWDPGDTQFFLSHVENGTYCTERKIRISRLNF
jgi:hypothetical protein